MKQDNDAPIEVEVLFTTRAKIAGHRWPEVVTYEDGPLVRALLSGGHVELINPPHLEGFNDREFSERKATKKKKTVETVSEDVIRKEDKEELQEILTEENKEIENKETTKQESETDAFIEKHPRSDENEVIYEQSEFGTGDVYR